MDWTGWGQALLRRWKKVPPAVRGRAAAVRRRSGQGLRGDFAGRVPLPLEAELQLYDDMRRSFPILDVAVTRLVQLCGHPYVEGPRAVSEELGAWMRHVPAGLGQVGIGSWLETHLDHALVYGKAASLVRLAGSRREVGALVGLDPRRITLEVGNDPGDLRVLYRGAGAYQPALLPAPLTLLTLHAPQGNPHGTSLLRSLPFAAEASSIVQNATAQTWRRLGSPSYHVNWRPENLQDPQGTISAEVTGALQQSLEEIMQARQTGEVRDFVTAGNVSVSLMGDASQTLAVQEPFRLFAEQMVAVTGLPPWLLGLHWSSTERLSTQQADLLVANIEALRREVHPQLERLLDLRQRLRGGSSRFRLVWPAVNLRDATEQARADAWAEQARQRRIENARRMWELGFWSQERAAREVDPDLARVDRMLEQPPGAPADLPARLTPAVDE
jgi:hypothetical protein